jgi:16S rRNA (uracil1498-N3)-methyltransferase
MVKQRLVLQPQQLQQIQAGSLSALTFTLTSEQQNYLYKVLRLKAGGEFIALSGQGDCWRAVLADNLGQVQILEVIPPNSDLKLDVTLAIAMPKGNGIESIIRQATELGVSRIMPLWSDRTIVRPHTNLGAAKLKRWLKIAQEICEQSCQTYVPEICEPQTFADVVPRFKVDNDQISSQINKYICVTTKPSPHLLNSLIKSTDTSTKVVSPTKIVILTGAEGGWTEAETALALAYNFQPVSLGDRILAAVTAPVVALSIVTAVIESQFDF